MFKVLGLVLVACLAWGGSAQATPLTYTFEGQISRIYDSAGILSAQGVSLGDSVVYTFLVDTDLSATHTLVDGSVYTYPDLPIRDYFFADLVGDGLVDEVNGGIYNAPFHVAEYNRGFTDLNHGLTSFVGGSNDNYVSVSSNNTFADMIAGLTNVLGYEHARDNLGNAGSFYADMTLTSVTDATSVPEPSSILLLAIGILTFGVSRRLARV